MSILVVVSVALDTVHTPFGTVTDAVGGSAVHFAAAASLFSRGVPAGPKGSLHEQIAARAWGSGGDHGRGAGSVRR